MVAGDRQRRQRGVGALLGVVQPDRRRPLLLLHELAVRGRPALVQPAVPRVQREVAEACSDSACSAYSPYSPYSRRAAGPQGRREGRAHTDCSCGLRCVWRTFVVESGELWPVGDRQELPAPHQGTQTRGD